MANMRAFAELRGDWAGCGPDSFDCTTIEPFLKTISEAPVEKRRKLLVETVEKSVIPSLSLSYSADNVQSVRRSRISSNDVNEFVHILIARDITADHKFIEKMEQIGVGVEEIFLELMTPAARVLGELWEEDVCDFTDVTIALVRLHQLLHHFGAVFDFQGIPVSNGRSALLVAAPGDQHTFGVFILQEFFRRAGWHTDGGAVASEDDLISLAASDRFDLVGVSASNELAVEEFAAVIRALRDVAGCQDMLVMVGGRFFLDHPNCVKEVGADASAQDGRRAVLGVSSLLDAKPLG
jgi:methanogenic corrinoid protein MtbC1